MAVDDEKKRSRFPGLKEGKELTTAGPGLEAVKRVAGGITGAITGGEPVKADRGYGLDKERGMGFMEAGIPIPEDQAGMMQTMPTRPAVGDISGATPPVVYGAPMAGGGAMPSTITDLTPRLGEIEAGVEGAIPSTFDTGKAHDLGMERYKEGQVYLPPGQKALYGDAIDSVLGPAPTVQPTPQGIPTTTPGGYDSKFADVMSRATSGRQGPGSSGNAMVDVLRWVSENARRKQQIGLEGEQKQRTLEAEKYAGAQEFKERKLASEEKGREGTLKLKRREAIATEAKDAEGLNLFMERAEDLIKDTDAYKYEQDPEKKETMLLTAAENVEARHRQSKPEGKGPKLKEGDERTIKGKTYRVIGGKVVELQS